MNCWPLDGEKMYFTGRSIVSYHWVNTKTWRTQSFNDQPAESFRNGVLRWCTEDNKRFSKYGKPYEVWINNFGEIEDMRFKDDEGYIYIPEAEDVHPDYRNYIGKVQDCAVWIT